MSNDMKLTDLEIALRQGKTRTYSKGELIQTTDDETQLVLMVKSGFVKRYLITADGLQSIQSVYGAGSVFPLTVVMKEIFDQDLYRGPETFYYEAMSSVELYGLEAATLSSDLEHDPLIYRDLLKVAGERLTSNIQRLENLALRSSYQRLAHQLLFYATTFGEFSDVGIRIIAPLTHQDLAYVLSVARETVSREISKLRQEQIITTDSTQYITVNDVKRLKQLAYS
ncbi:MAG: Crp/Fnr family transcriptional regulator [Candidatus Saccharimonadales bacterium]